MPSSSLSEQLSMAAACARPARRAIAPMIAPMVAPMIAPMIALLLLAPGAVALLLLAPGAVALRGARAPRVRGRRLNSVVDDYRAALAAQLPEVRDDAWWDTFAAASERPLRASLRCVDAAAAASFLAGAAARNRTATAVPWAAGRGFFVDGGPPLGRDAAHVAGDFYVMEAASMLPAACLVDGLDAAAAAVVVDACAAPGGKTVHLAAALRDARSDAAVVANELSSSRLGALVANCRRAGVLDRVAFVHGDAGAALAAVGSADGILLDAPCSGDTQARRDGTSLRAHLAAQPKDLGPIVATQTRLLDAAWAALRPGGALVYSTCSLRPEEDEEVVAGLLARAPDAALEDLGHVYAGAPSALLPGCLRVWPQDADTAGFFAARLRKAGVSAPLSAARPACDAALRAAAATFFEGWGLEIDGAALERDGAALWHRPAAPPLAGLRYNRVGAKLLEGLKVRGRAPATDAALARAIASGAVRVAPDFAATFGRRVSGPRRVVVDEAAAAAYLRGDDVEVPALGVSGQVLVATDELVLGLAKAPPRTPGGQKKTRLKNQLPPACARRDVTF